MEYLRVLVCVMMLTVKECQSQNYFRRVCYFASWAQTRLNTEARVQLDQIDPYLCTHLVYAFGNIDAENLDIVPMEWNDMPTETTPGNYDRLKDLKDTNRRLKTMISIGGAKAGSVGFKKISATANARKKFAANAIKFLRKWDFDGLDIDWEFPDDRRSLAALTKDLMNAFKEENQGSRRLQLSIAVGVSEKHMQQGYNVPELVKHVDFINLMGYDFHGSWDRFTGGNSPLYSRHHDRRFNHHNSLEWTVTRWLQAGTPPRKLVLGLPLQGRSFLLDEHSGDTGVGARSLGPGLPGPHIRESGSMAYYEVCEFIDKGGHRRWDKIQKFPYTFMGNQWISYDNVRSIAMKTTWMQQQGLGGIMLWSLDLDDPSGKFCNQGPFPLATTVKAVLEGKRLVGLDHLRSRAPRIAPLYLNGLSIIFSMLLLFTNRL